MDRDVHIRKVLILALPDRRSPRDRKPGHGHNVAPLASLESPETFRIIHLLPLIIDYLLSASAA